MSKYKYMRKDFKPLPVKLEHMDIFLNFIDGKVQGRNILRITAIQNMNSVRLDAQDLEIHSVHFKQNSSPETDWIVADYDYDRDKNSLSVYLPEPIRAGATFNIKTASSCTPSETILDGLYLDTTPDGCPQQYMSQCQQWGFQRILPVFDDCTAKCTMTTTIEADSRYTHLISNGNICKDTNPEGKPVPLPDNPSRQKISFNNPIPMAPYLFIAAVGTWEVLEDEVVYPSGRTVKLEYLVPPGRIEGAKIPMQILKQSVIWQNKTQGYEYKHDVYRTICMEKSNFGGMENVGNTTIITSAALIDEWTSDRRIEYAHGVIVHEFEHNQCGSDVTMETPFDMWLNEAFTVDVERQFLSSIFDPDCTRLSELDSLRAPISGPLAIEDAGHMGNIVREGFNHPDEVVDGVTYVKAPEVIRMLRLMLGQNTFKKAKNLYFERFNGSNGNTDDFFNCFEEVSGRDLSQFKKAWLFTIGYPIITASYNYSSKDRRLDIEFRQTRSGVGCNFHVPIEMAALDQNGNDISQTARIIELTNDKHTETFKDIDNPAFLSLNRDGSFYGIMKDVSATSDLLIKQVRLDSNSFNRVEAMCRITDIERVKLIEKIDLKIASRWLNIYGELLCDQTLPPGLKYYLLRIDEMSLERKYLPYYRERYSARAKLLESAAVAHTEDLIKVFNNTDTYSPGSSPADGIEERQLKAVLLRTIIETDSDQAQKLAADHFRKATNISDKVSALSCIVLSSHPEKRKLLNETFHAWKKHLNAYMAYLSLIGIGRDSSVIEMIKAEEQRSEFNLKHPGHSCSLYLSLTSNNKILWTPEGLNWLSDTVIKLTPASENSALRLVGCLQQVDKLADDLKKMAKTSLTRMLDAIDSKKYPSVSGRIKTYLGANCAVDCRNDSGTK